MNILIVDDSPHIHAQLNAFLQSDQIKKIISAQNAAEAFAHLGINTQASLLNIDLILMDIMLPDMNGIEICRRIKTIEHLKDIPIIMITSDTSEQSLLAAFDAGAADYIAKPLKKIELFARTSSILRLKREMDERKAREQDLLRLKKKLEESNRKLQLANHKLQLLSITDPLTGIYNRRYFNEQLRKEWKRCARHSRQLSIILIDVDYFKKYNDIYGHLCGDECLKKLAQGLNNCLNREGDCLARFGGEEFIALLPEINETGALKVAKKMQKTVKELHIVHAGSEINHYLTVSIGIACTTCSQENPPESIVQAADNALYTAKNAGRNKIKLSRSDGPVEAH